MIAFPAETAVVMHDAGAANLILGWIDAGLIPNTRVFAAGPAARLWHDTVRPALAQSPDAALDGAAALVSGTGWQSDIEHQARKRAADAAIPSFAVLDHWVNYHDRFTRQGETLLPDELIVADMDALELARVQFPGISVHQLPNLYLENTLAEIAAAERRLDHEPHGLLLVLEPARDDWGRRQDGCFQALDHLISNWDRIGLPADLPLRLRPHPSDPEGHYDRWMADNADLHPTLSRGTGLASDLAAASHVAGLNSFALTIALAAGRTTLSILPPWAPPCVLPHKGIQHLRNISEAVNL